MTTKTITTISRHSELPADTSEVVRQLVSHATIKRYPARVPVVTVNEPSASLFFMLKGSVAVFILEGNREIVVDYLNVGDFFGEMGLFEETPVRTASIRTRTICEIAEISYDTFHELSSTNSDLASIVFAQTSSRLRRTTQKVTNLAFVDVTGRIARCILELAQQPDTLMTERGQQIRITRQELGRLVGCSREMVGRVLKSLEDQHMIEVNGKAILILDQAI